MGGVVATGYWDGWNGSILVLCQEPQLRNNRKTWLWVAAVVCINPFNKISTLARCYVLGRDMPDPESPEFVSLHLYFCKWDCHWFNASSNLNPLYSAVLDVARFKHIPAQFKFLDEHWSPSSGSFSAPASYFRLLLLFLSWEIWSCLWSTSSFPV